VFQWKHFNRNTELLENRKDFGDVFLLKCFHWNTSGFTAPGHTQP
jgi:hypothetical protein